MFLDPADDPREDAPSLLDERGTLREFLRCQRLTLEVKCQGLDGEAMARRSVEPSTLSLLGLVRHMSNVERYWFREVMAGTDNVRRYGTGDADFDGAVADPAVVEEAWRAWREDVAFADEVIDGIADLGTTAKRRDGALVSLREVLVHMVEEYARHNGHADLLRERIDGRVGQ